MAKDKKCPPTVKYDGRDTPNICIYGDNKNWTSKDSHPSGNSRSGYGGGSNDSGSMNYGNSYGSNYGNSSSRTSIDSSSGVSTYNSIIKMSEGGYGDGKRFMGERIMNLKSASLTDGQVGQLMYCLQYEGLKLDVFDVSCNNLSNIAVNSIFFNFSSQRSGTSIYDIKFINLSSNQIGDEGAKRISEHLSRGEYPHLKSLDLSGNQISNTGSGYIANAMQSVNQGLTVTLNKVKGFSKDAFKSVAKSMLYIAKSNGISTKEMLTTDETIEHCKKGSINVALNISWGLTKCTVPIVKYFKPKDLTLQDLLLDVSSMNPYTKGVATAFCIVQESYFSVVDKDFANCLTGVDSLLDN